MNFIQKLNDSAEIPYQLAQENVMNNEQVNLRKEIGLRIKQLREKFGFSQQKMAALFNVTRQSYWAYESGEVFPSYTGLKMLADYLAVSLDWLVCGKGPMLTKDHAAGVQESLLNVSEPDLQELFNQATQVPLLRFKLLSVYHEFKLDHPQLFTPQSQIPSDQNLPEGGL